MAVAAILSVGAYGAMTFLDGKAPDLRPASAPPAVAAATTPPPEPTASPTPDELSTPSPLATSPETSPSPQDKKPTHEPTGDQTSARVIKSSNWAGYGLLGDQYVSVSAEWTQPEVNCIHGRDAHVSFWVGLDGAGSGSVQQIGTAAECSSTSGASADYYSWFEMYPSPMRRAYLEVHPGDHFKALVNGLSAERFELRLENVTTGQVVTEGRGRLGDWPQSAEWVVEPGAICDVACTTSELARFADITFTNVTAATIDGSVALGAASDQLLRFELYKKAKRIADTSPLASDGTSFGVSWIGTAR